MLHRYSTYLAIAALGLGTLYAGTATAAGAGEPTPTCEGHAATIVGTPDAEKIHGTSRADVIVAGEGADEIWGGDGADLICSGQGSDFVDAGPGADIVHGDKGDDDLYGAAGNDRLYGDAFGPWQQSNLLIGGPGDDRLFGKPNSRGDVTSYEDSVAGIRLDGSVVRVGGDTDHLHGIGTVFGSAHRDRMRGTARRDQLHGMGGDDIITGLAGADSIDTGFESDAGNDRIRGGRGGDNVDSGSAGNDRISVGRGDDIVFGFVGKDHYDGGPGTDRLTSESTKSLTIDIARGHASGGTDSTFERFEKYAGGDGKDRILGSAGPDVIESGDSYPDRILGRGGNDRLTGNGTVLGGAGRDTVRASGTARGGPGTDHVAADAWPGKTGHAEGGSGNDIVSSGRTSPGDGDRIFLRGGAGDDTVNAWNSRISPLRGMYGGPGHDVAAFGKNDGSSAGATLRIDLAERTVSGRNPRSAIDLVSFNDVRGGMADDTILGDGGNNQLRGGQGEDSVDGRGGRDTCTAETVTACEP